MTSSKDFWQAAALVKDLKRRPARVEFGGEPVVLFKSASGISALADRCPHRLMELSKGKVVRGEIECPYHGWRFGPDGVCDDIPYHDGPKPRSAKLTSYPVVEQLGGIWMWFDPDGGEPAYPAPDLAQWHQPQWIHWRMDHLGELPVNPQEVIDNMADARHRRRVALADAVEPAPAGRALWRLPAAVAGAAGPRAWRPGTHARADVARMRPLP